MNNKTSNTNNNFNKTKKIYIKKPKIVKNPYIKYINTKLIPNTRIINNMFLEYNSFLEYQKKCYKEKREVMYLDDCFLIIEDSIQNGLKKNKLNLSFKMNPKTTLDKFLAYCYYTTQSSIFKKNINEGLQDLKNQIGKDIRRQDRIINNKSYPYSFFDKDDNFKDTDLLYNLIIGYMKLYYNKINLNLVNKIVLLSSQNIFNFMSNLILLKLYEIIKQKTIFIFKPQKNSTLNIKTNIMTIEFHFKSQLLISIDDEPINPEYPCGNLEYRLFIDLLNNKYELKNFILDYDLDKCGNKLTLNEELINNETVTNDETTKNNKKKSNMKYIIPATIVTAGIVTLPFVLPLLGGKNKKNKTKKIRKLK
jgi:hypothetical protein